MNINKNNLIKIAEAFHKAQTIQKYFPKKIELTAEEPFLYKDGQSEIKDLIRDLKSRDFKIKVTTNGSLLHKCIDKIRGQVDKIRISFHNISNESFKKITGVDCIETVQRNILLAKKSGINITLNRLILRDYLDDMEEYMDFVVENGLRLKLLLPHYNFEEFESFQSQNKLLNKIIKKYIKPRSIQFPYIAKNSGISSNKIYPLHNNALVDLRLPIRNMIKLFPYCRNCENLSNCYQSNCLLLTSVKITPDYKLFFCSVKNTPLIDLSNFEIEKWSEQDLSFYLLKELDKLGLKHNKGFYLPIRAIVTEKCNFKCYFCHAEGLKL